MAHPFMAAVADGLAERNVATLRYQFPYMEEGSKRPDVPKVAHATVRAAVGEALRLLPGLAVVAGGKSFGGRDVSSASGVTIARGARPGVPGLPAAPRRAAIGRAWSPSIRDQNSNVVFTGKP
jgi:uncharacterized protein